MEQTTNIQPLTASLLHWVISALALMITAYLMPGFEIKGFVSALIAALVIGIANAVVYPLLVFLTLPITILTLGLFLLVVNGIFLKICAAFVPGFEIDGIFPAIFGSVILSFVGYALHRIVI